MMLWIQLELYEMKCDDALEFLVHEETSLASTWDMKIIDCVGMLL